MDKDALDSALLAAHADADPNALIRLYTLAGDLAEADADMNAASFYLTHAFVFALEVGAPEAKQLNSRLADQGRAHRLAF